jgi:Reverse transcriptase (RNA-dependent DNA polymerase)
MAVASASDLSLLRADAGLIIKVTDPMLSDSVCSYRLDPWPIPGSAWAFDRRNSWKDRFVAGGIEILDKAEFPFMCRTDIRKYYPSIQIDLVRESLLMKGCDAQAVARIFEVIKFWQEFHGLSGLPIGPEASAVLSNFFLRPIDNLMGVIAGEYKRYGDDMLIFSLDRPMGKAPTEFLDEELRDLQLTLSLEKTKFFDDPAEAKANLRDAEIDYMQDATIYDRGIGLYTVKRSFRRFLYTAPDDFKLSRWRWVLKYLKNRRDPDGCFDLSRRTDLMNVDPKAAANYLAVGIRDQRVLTDCMQRLAQPREERFDGLTLHQLRLMSGAKTGKAEAKEFERIASDQSTPWPTRSWAWAAYAHADGTKPSRLMEAARDEADPNIRRAIIATLKRHSDSPQCRTFLRDEAERCPANKYTAEWAKAA